MSLLGSSELTKIEEAIGNVSLENMPQLLQHGLKAGNKKYDHGKKLPSIEQIEDAFDHEENEGVIANYLKLITTSFNRYMTSDDTAAAIEQAVNSGN